MILVEHPRNLGAKIRLRVLWLQMKDGHKYTVSNLDFLELKEKGRKEWELADEEFDEVLNILRDKIAIQIVDPKTKEVIGLYGKEVAEFSN
jgi:hypothetical protein